MYTVDYVTYILYPSTDVQAFVCTKYAVHQKAEPLAGIPCWVWKMVTEEKTLM